MSEKARSLQLSGTAKIITGTLSALLLATVGLSPAAVAAEVEDNSDNSIVAPQSDQELRPYLEDFLEEEEPELGPVFDDEQPAETPVPAPAPTEDEPPAEPVEEDPPATEPVPPPIAPLLEPVPEEGLAQTPLAESRASVDPTVREQIPWMMYSTSGSDRLYEGVHVWNTFPENPASERYNYQRQTTGGPWDPVSAWDRSIMLDVPVRGTEGYVYDTSTGACLYSIVKPNNLASQSSVFGSLDPDSCTMFYNSMETYLSLEFPGNQAQAGLFVTDTAGANFGRVIAGLADVNWAFVSEVLWSAKPVATGTFPSEIMGTGVPGSEIAVRNSSGTLLCEAGVEPNGTWQCDLLPPVEVGATLQLTQQQLGKKVLSASVASVVTVRGPSASLEAGDVAASPNRVGGEKAVPGAEIIVKDDTGQVLCTAEVNENGTGTCAPSRSLEVGEVLEVTQVEPEKSPTTTPVPVNEVQTAPPDIVKAATNGVRGTGVVGATVEVVAPLNSSYTCGPAPVIVGADGAWRCTFFNPAVGGSAQVEPGRFVIATQFSPGELRSVAETAPVAPRSAPPGDIVIGGGSASGTGSDGSTITVTKPDGGVLCEAVVEGGVWSCEYDEEETKDGGDYQVIQETETESPSLPITVVLPGPFDPNSSTITGDTSPAIANGVESRRVEVSIKDAKGIPLVGATVEFDDPGGLQAVGERTVTTDVDGNASIELSSIRSGPFPVTANISTTVAPTPVAIGKSVTLTFVAGPFDSGNSTYTVDEQPAVVSVEESLVTVRVADTFGNPLTEATGTFSATGKDQAGNEVQFGPFEPTEWPGGYQASISSDIAGSFAITVSYDAGAGPELLKAQGNTNAVFVAGSPSLGQDGKSSIAAEGGPGIADGSSSVQAVATILDAQGNPVPGVTVTFAAAPELTAADSHTETDEDGRAVVSYTTTVAGSFTVTAKVGEEDVAGQAVLVYESGTYSAQNTTMAVSTGTRIANGVDAHTVFLSVRDGNENLTTLSPEADVSITVDPGPIESVQIGQPILNPETGIYEVLVTSTSSGIKMVDIEVDGTLIPSTTTHNLEFVAGPPSLGPTGKSTITGQTEPAVADGETRRFVDVAVKDEFGNPLSSEYVQFQSPGDLTSVGLPMVITDSAGFARLEYTSQTPGSFAVTATIGAGPIENGSPATLNFVAGELSMSDSSFEVSTGSRIADGADAHTLTVTLKDAHDNPYLIEPGELAGMLGASLSPADGVAVSPFLPGPTPGTYVAQITSTIAGQVGVEATVEGAALPGSATALFVAGPPVGGDEENSSALSTPVDSAVANGQDPATVAAVIRDAHGNPVPGVEVTFVGATELSTAEDTATTDSAGQALAQFTATAAGTYEAKASFEYGGQTIQIDRGSPALLTFRVGSVAVDPLDPQDPASPVSELRVTDTEAPADGVQKLSADIVLVDAFGNPVAGIDVRFVQDSSDLVVEPALAGTTSAAGIYTAAFSTTKAGAYQLRAEFFDADSDTWIPLKRGVPATLTFTPGAPVVGEDALSSITATTGAVAADGLTPQTVTVTITDKFGNPVPGIKVEVTADEELALLGTSDFETDSAGVLTLYYTSETAGEHQVSAKLGADTVKGSPVSLSYQAGEFSSTGSYYYVSSGPVEADGEQTHTISVFLGDAQGNILPDIDTELLSGVADPGAGVTVGEFFAETGMPGIIEAKVTSESAGDKTITVTYGGREVSLSGNAVAKFVAGDASLGQGGLSTLAGQPGTAIANGSATRFVRATLVDRFGNPIVGAPVTFEAPGELTASQLGQVTTDSTGQATLTYATLVAGTYQVSATAFGQSVGTPVSLTFVPDEVDVARSEYSVTGGTRTADGVQTHQVQVITRDAAGNLADLEPGATLTLSSAPNDVVLSGFTSGGPGLQTATVSSTVAGKKAISVSLDQAALPAGGNSVAEFVAGAPVVDASSATRMWGQTEPAVADGASTRSISVLVADAFGNPVPNQEVLFQAPEGLVALAASATTDDTGTATLNFVTTSAATYQVTASVEGSQVVNGSPVTLSFRAGRPSVDSSIFVVSEQARVANGADPHRITVTLLDANLNPVTPQDFDLSALAAAVQPAVGIDRGDFEYAGTPGIYQADLTSTVADTYQVTASYDAEEITAHGNDQALFIAGAADMEAATLTTQAGEALANGLDTRFAEVALQDENKNPLVGQDVVFTTDGGSKVFALRGNTATTNGLGIARVEFASLIAGEFAAHATVNGAAVTNGDGSLVRFEAGQPDVSASTYSVSTGAFVANGQAKHTVSIAINDAAGNVVADADLTKFALSATPNAGVVLETVVKKGDGTYTATVASTVAGLKDISVTYDEAPIPAGGNTQAEFKAGPAVASASTIEGQDGTAVANGLAPRWVQVTARDAFANPVPGALVAFNGTDGLTGDLTSPLATDADGIALISYTTIKAGTYQVGATIQGAPVADGRTATLEFIGAEPASKTSTFFVSSDARSADGEDAHLLTVQVRDANGNVTTVDAAALQGLVTAGPAATISGFTATPVPGTYTAEVTSTIAGQASILVNMNQEPLAASGNSVALFVSGDIDLGRAGNSTLSGQTAPSVANGVAQRTVTATLRDRFGNPVAGQSVEFQASQGLIGLATSATTDAQGRATVPFVTTEAGTYPVTATVGGEPIENGSPVSLTFLAGAFAAKNSAFTVSAGDRIANGADAHQVTVVVRDADRNLVTLTGDQLKLLVGKTPAPAVVGAFVATEAPGIYRAPVTSAKAGKFIVSVSYDGTTIPVNGTATVSFVAGSPEIGQAGPSTIAGQPGPARANGAATRWVKVTLLDKLSNPISGKVITFRTSSATLMGAAQAITDSTGVATVNYTTTTPGTYTVRGYLGGVEIARGAPASVTFESDVPSTIGARATIAGTKKVGQTVTATVTGMAPGTTYTYQWSINGKAIAGATGKTWVLPAAAGGRNVSVVAVAKVPGFQVTATVQSAPYGVIQILVERLSGPDRYSTSEKIAAGFGATGGPLFVATGASFPDALSVGPAVAKVNGTFALTSSTTLSPSVKALIASKKPSRIYIIGGQSSVSAAVETQLQAASGKKPDRIGGSTRYQTSEMILARFFPTASTAYVATGQSYPDALAASRAAAHVGGPVILVDGKTATKLTPGVQQSFAVAGVKTVRVAGGDSSVNKALYDFIAGKYSATRVFGPDRYATAIRINEAFTVAETDTVWLAAGTNFPDALSAAGAGGVAINAPLFLTGPSCVPANVVAAISKYTYGKRLIVGGASSVSNAAMGLTVCR